MREVTRRVMERTESEQYGKGWNDANYYITERVAGEYKDAERDEVASNEYLAAVDGTD